MGNVWYTYVSHPDTAPDFRSPPTFDPLYGFPNGRQERKIKATREELDKANIPLNRRDYCVDHFLALTKCRQEYITKLSSPCSHYLHEWEHCLFEDTTLRVKEWERERRLKERAKRKAEREKLEAME
uniref:NADH dehydrogenase [ubiquinone] 1 beta subcomplex subunit 7 n=1 Tax=Arion vulgaris TaxID=1028688 RepID=A0A0B7A071_9EUPU